MSCLRSPDDKRGGSITIVLIEGKDTRKEILGAIETSSFLKNNSIGYVNYMASICHKFNFTKSSMNRNEVDEFIEDNFGPHDKLAILE